MLYPSELQARGWFRGEAELSYKNDSNLDWLLALAGTPEKSAPLPLRLGMSKCIRILFWQL